MGQSDFRLGSVRGRVLDSSERFWATSDRGERPRLQHSSFDFPIRPKKEPGSRTEPGAKLLPRRCRLGGSPVPLW